MTADQVSAAHPAVVAGVSAVVAECENGESPEVVVAHDADELECLLQAVGYREQGYQDVRLWIDSSLGSLKTDSARELVEAALTMTSLEWQKVYLGSSVDE
ncbi:HD domain-containing protein [Streptomyces sp. NRRL S-350]|uniref:HD domain-containing protein n=1 Tax=Streptomyces sp. NRRL S-350 TaxID=1463902 RepID=UPI000B221551|nr:HD domain-containing protein [Streptomyces sp. NRRL S-350]